MPQNLFNKYKNHSEEVHVLAKDQCSQEFIELSVCWSVCDEESFILDGSAASSTTSVAVVYLLF